jgi:cyclohexyl-isocyanide hydratase
MNSCEDMMKRRSLLRAALAAPLLPALMPGLAFAASTRSPFVAESVDNPLVVKESWNGEEQIAMLLYPGMTALDLVGPQYFFACLMGAQVHLVARTLEPVKSDTGLSIVPTATFSQCPEVPDVLFVPGAGEGVLDAMDDPDTVEFVRSRGVRAGWVTSVCTGSLLLGKAGLLRGYTATGHWVARDLLAEFGAIASNERVVRDRNRVTGAGVSAGLDLGLVMASLLRDRQYAKNLQLLAEYDPAPAFDAGNPNVATEETVKFIGDMFTEFRARAIALANVD